jgi:putative phosphoesterase
MRVGIVSDSHDNGDAARVCVRIFQEKGVERILHAGDIVAPFTAQVFLEAGVPVDAVFGNNDGETELLSKVLPGIEKGWRRLRIGGHVVLLVHDRHHVPPQELEGARLLVHGHTHDAECVETGGRIELNPGECGGWLRGRKTLALWDTEGGLPEILEFETG